MIQACIFDLDGVIVDTAKYHYLAWKRLANELGFDLSPEQNELLKGVSRMDSLNIILYIGGVSLSEEQKHALADKKNAWFTEQIERMTPDEILPGSLDLLQVLRSKDYAIALASSSKNAPRVLEILKITDLFDVVVDGTMITNSKPDPEIFLMAAELLAKAPAHCLVFEDAEAGVEAAHKAGMKCIGIGQANQLSQADFVYQNLAEVSFDLINRL